MKRSPLVTSSFLPLTLLARSTLAETSPSPGAAKAAPSVTSQSVQSAIVATVEEDRKRFGGHEPIPATLIGVWDSNGHSFIRTFGYADLEKKVPLTPADHFRIGSNTKTFVISVLLQLVAEKKNLASTTRSAASRSALPYRMPRTSPCASSVICAAASSRRMILHSSRS